MDIAAMNVHVAFLSKLLLAAIDWALEWHLAGVSPQVREQLIQAHESLLAEVGGTWWILILNLGRVELLGGWSGERDPGSVRSFTLVCE